MFQNKKKLQSAVSLNKKGYTFLIKDVGAWLLMVPTLIILYFWVLRPIVIGIMQSFYKMQGFEPQYWTGLENYKAVLSDTRFFQILTNTCKYVFWGIVIGYLPPVIVAIMINEMIHLKGFFKFSMYLPCMVSGVACSLIWYYIYLPDGTGLLNTVLNHLGLPMLTWLQNEAMTIPLIIISSTWRGFGGTMLMYLAALQGINRELYEAAVIDGSGFFRRIFNITIPQIRGVMLLFVIRQMIGVFQIFTEPMTMTGGGPNNASMSMGLWSYNNAFIYYNTGHSLAISVIMFMILIVLTVVYFTAQKKFDD